MWIGFGIAAVVVGLWPRRAVPGRGIPLPDRSGQVVVWKASFGTNHVLTWGRWPALDELRRRFPKAARWLGPTTEQDREFTEIPALMVFHSVEPLEGATNRGTWHPSWGQGTEDQHGCFLPGPGGMGSRTFHGRECAHQDFECYPRRDPAFDLLFGRDGSPTDRVRVRLENPAPWRGVEWVPEPFPVTRESNGLGVRFEGWRDHPHWPSPRYAVLESGGVSEEWEIRRQWFEDATGNRHQTPGLCRHEPAWRWRVRLGRRPDRTRDPGLVWEVATHGVPGAGEAVVVDDARVLDGVTVRVWAYGGPGVFRFEQRGGWELVAADPPPAGARGDSMSSGGGTSTQPPYLLLRSERPWMALNPADVGAHQEWSVLLVDDQGRHHRNMGWSSSGGRMTFCRLELPEGSRGVAWKVMVQTLREFDFTVAPPLAR